MRSSMNNSSRVLIADDDSNFCLLAKSALKTAGFDAESVENGEQLLIRLELTRPDIVLLDVVMPEMDGFTACEHIRQSPEYDDLPVLMITGLDDLDSISRAYDSGATDIISKPVNWLVLCYRVRFLLRSTQRIKGIIKRELQDLANLYALSDLIIQEPDQNLDYQRVEWLKSIRTLERAVGSEILRSVTHSYVEETPVRLQFLRDSLASGDYFSLQTEATQLKSKSFNLFLTRIVSLCKDLEMMDNPNCRHEAENVISDIETEFAEIKTLLQREILPCV